MAAPEGLGGTEDSGGLGEGRDVPVASAGHRRSALLEAVAALTRVDHVDDLLSRTATLAAGLVGATYAVVEVVDDEQPGPTRPVVEHGEAPDVGGPADPSPLAVPLLVRGAIFAELRLHGRPGRREFTAADEELVVALAAAAGATIENVGLRLEAQHRQQWLAASAEVTATLVGQSSELDVLQLVADRARELAGARVGWVITGPDPENLELRVTSGMDVDLDYLRTLPLDHSLVSDVLATGEPLRVAHLSADRRVARHGPVPGSPELGPAIVVPLEAVGVRGALGLGWALGDRPADAGLESSLLAGFAQQASLALTVFGAQHDQRQLAVLRDRDRIGRDLHDVVIQRLFAIGLGLEALDRLPEDQHAARIDDAVDQIDETIRDLRGAIHALQRAGATRDVQEQVAEVVAWSEPVLGFRPVLRLRGPVRTRMPEAVVPDLLAVLGEAISNVGRHADASAVRVELAVVDDEVVLTVRDDGRGLVDPERESGLGNIRHRAARLGGDATIRAAPDRGTQVEWRVPARPAAPA